MAILYTHIRECLIIVAFGVAYIVFNCNSVLTSSYMLIVLSYMHDTVRTLLLFLICQDINNHDINFKLDLKVTQLLHIILLLYRTKYTES